VAYTNILWTLIVVFALFSLMLLPTMNIYQQGTGVSTGMTLTYEAGMLGNMGYSSVQCASIPLDVGRI